MNGHSGSLLTDNQLARLIRGSTQGVRDRVTGIAAFATGTWGQLETLFLQRVSRALHALQIPTARDVQELGRRVAALQLAVERLERARAERASPPARARRRRPAA